MAGQVVVELTAQDKVSGVLSKINAEAKRLKDVFRDAASSPGRTFDNLKGKAVGAFNRIKGQAVSLQGVLGSLGVGAAVKGFADAGVEADRTAKRLKFLGDQFGETSKLQEFAKEAADKFTLGQTDAAKAVADLFGRLRPMGTSMEDIKTVFNGVNVAAKQMSLSTADVEGVMLQLSQALGSGKLQGDEFRSIMERLPKIGQAVAKSMGVSVDQLKDLSSQGKLTTKEIIKALKGIEKQGFPEADGVAQFNKAMKDLSTTIGQRLTPILNPILKGIAGLVKMFLDLPKPVQSAVIGFTAIAVGLAAIAPLLPVVAAGIAAIVAAVTGPVGIVAAVGGAIAAFVTMKSSAEKAKAPMEQVSNEADKTKAATEAAARAKQAMIEKTKEHLAALEQELSQITQAQQAYENTVKVTDARLNAEREINSLQGQILERAYDQAGSAKERLNIAKRIFQNEVEGAKLAYQQTINSIKAEQQRLEFRKQAAQVELKIIQAKGELAAAQAKSKEQAQQILEKTKNLVAAQKDNIRLLGSQIDTQKQIAGFQEEAAKAQFESKKITAQQNLEQKLVSKEIGLSKGEAKQLSDRLGDGVTASSNLSTQTEKVSDNASQAAGHFKLVAHNANTAAEMISRAAAQQERLNRARLFGGAGGGGKGPVGQAQGGYNLGSFKAFAQGGVVKGPTLGLIGEGGEPEYIIPESKAAGFATNYLQGQRGASAIPGFKDGGFVGPINITTGPVMQQDGTRYVTLEDLENSLEALASNVFMNGRSAGARRYQGI